MRFDSRPTLFAKNGPDPWVIGATCVLAVWGVIMVYSASMIVAERDAAVAALNSGYLKKQFIFSILGIGVMLAVAHIDYHVLAERRFAYGLLAMVTVMLVISQIPALGYTAGGAARWIRLGPVGFQPSELAKAAVALFLAASIARKGDEKMQTFAFGVVPHLLIPGLVMLILAGHPDLGSAAIIGGTVVVMLFVGGARLTHLIGMGGVLVAGMTVAIISAPHAMRRIKGFVDPWADPYGTGYHIIQSLTAFGSGGLFGRGLGDGRQKLSHLPAIHTDFIFSNVAEERGFVGVALTMALFAVLILRGMWVARRAPDPFGRYLAFGMVSLLGLEIVVNMGVVMALLPTKGLALPFLSYGGSSILVSFAMVGVILSVSRHIDTGPRRTF